MLILLAAALAGSPDRVLADRVLADRVLADRVLIADSDQAEPETQLARHEQWIAARIEAARSGTPEAVRLPITFRSMGWGCRCPEVFVGTSPDMFTAGPWVRLTYAEGVVPPSPPREGLIVVAEGHFTGTPTTLDLQPEGESIPEWIYTLQGFQVTAWRPQTEAAEDDWMAVLPAAKPKDAQGL